MGMERETNRPKDSSQSKVSQADLEAKESLLIRQRLGNLCELAIAIGQRKGLFANFKVEKEGGRDVADQRNIRGCNVAQAGENKAWNQERRS